MIGVKNVLSCLTLMLLLLLPATAAAHQPRVVVGEKNVEINNPEVSQAFYALLEGEPDVYLLEKDEPFSLYISMLVPALPAARTDFTVTVVDGEDRSILTLNGGEHQWETFFEPFAGDRYLQGPEIEVSLMAGDYRIYVTNPANSGKYVLSVGRQERFSPREIAAMIRELPAVKSFFGKSPWMAFFNLVGLFMLLTPVAAAAALYGLYRLFMLWKLRQG
ncbi:MAG: hypothetical protein KGZ45_11810 [Clostridium sp.]|nr:hypothetical protein [Clostridium sp.]